MSIFLSLKAKNKKKQHKSLDKKKETKYIN